MHQVYRVQEFNIDTSAGGDLVLSVRCSCEPYGTSLLGVLKAAYPMASIRAGRKTMAALFERRGEFGISGMKPTRREVKRLVDQLTELLTVCDTADVSHCLGLYRVPDDDVPPDDWTYTDVGRTIYRAKYRHNGAAARELGDAIVARVGAHPILAAADAVCAVPASGSGKHFDSPSLWAKMVSKSTGQRLIRLTRNRTVTQQKTIQSNSERARNQQLSMECSALDGQSVLVLDDLYMSGETIKEATRALRAAGAKRVFVLCAVKTATGTMGGARDLIPVASSGEDS